MRMSDVFPQCPCFITENLFEIRHGHKANKWLSLYSVWWVYTLRFSRVLQSDITTAIPYFPDFLWPIRSSHAVLFADMYRTSITPLSKHVSPPEHSCDHATAKGSPRGFLWDISHSHMPFLMTTEDPERNCFPCSKTQTFTLAVYNNSCGNVENRAEIRMIL